MAEIDYKSVVSHHIKVVFCFVCSLIFLFFFFFSSDTEFVATFILTFHTFMPPEVLMDSLVARSAALP